MAKNSLEYAIIFKWEIPKNIIFFDINHSNTVLLYAIDFLYHLLLLYFEKFS